MGCVMARIFLAASGRATARGLKADKFGSEVSGEHFDQFSGPGAEMDIVNDAAGEVFGDCVKKR